MTTINKTYLEKFIEQNQKLRVLAAAFVAKLVKEQVDEEQISFESSPPRIKYSYEENTSCHCHPEWNTTSDYYSMEDFLEWLEETKNQELED